MNQVSCIMIHFIPVSCIFFCQKIQDTIIVKIISSRIVFVRKILSRCNPAEKSLNCLNNYPSIKKLFIKYNTSLCSSAPVERLFSFASFVHSPSRSNLSDKTFENLIFLKSNQYFIHKNNI